MRIARPATRLRSAFVAAVLVLAFAATDAHASVADLMVACSDRALDPVERIEACDAITNRGEATRGEIAEARMWRGYAYLDQERFDDARIEFRHALLFDAEDAKAREGCVAAILAMGLDTQAASQAAENACAIVSTDQPTAGTGVGEFDFRNEGPSRFDSLLAVVDPETATLMQRYLDLRAQQDWDPAAQAYSEAAQRDERMIRCSAGSALQSAIMRAYDMTAHPAAYDGVLMPRTLLELDQALEEDPADTQALRERGLLFLAVGHWDAARRDLWHAVETDPSPEAAKVLLVRYLLAREGWERGRIMKTYSETGELRALPENEAHELFELPLILIREAIDEGATGLLVDITLGETLMKSDGYFDNDELILAEIIAAFERARENLPETASDLVEQEISAMVHMWLSHAYFALDDMEAVTASMLAYENSDAAYALCGLPQ